MAESGADGHATELPAEELPQGGVFVRPRKTKIPVSELLTGIMGFLSNPLCGEDEIRTRGTGCPVRRFSKPVVSATHPPLRTRLPAVNSERVCKYRIFLGKYKEMRSKFVFLRKSSTSV